jgi:hypothetical protein
MCVVARLACGLVLGALLIGCADDAGERTRGLGTDTVEIDRAEVERYAGVELPSGLSGFQAQKSVGGMDDSISATFTIPRDAVDSMRSILTEPLEEGFRTIGDEPSLGWKIQDSKRFLGASDFVNGVGRDVLVDLDVPGRPTVYLTAGTI